VAVCSPTFEKQDTWDPIRDRVNVHFDCLGNFVTIVQRWINEQNGEPVLVILDDVSYDESLNKGGKGPLNYISYNAVWINTSFLVICHRLKNVGQGMRENLENLVLFHTISDKEIEALSETYSITGNKKDFMEIYRQLVASRVIDGSNPYAFMYICFKAGIRVYEDFSTKINL